MSTFHGADVAELRTAGQRFTSAAADLQTVLSSLTQRIADPSHWTGADADRFRSEWSTSKAPALKAVAHALQDAGTALLRNADEQERTSSGSSISTSLSSSPTGVTGTLPGFSVSPNTLMGLGSIALGLADDSFGDVFSAAGYVTAGVELGNNLASGDVLGALNDTSGIASDLFKEAPVGTAPHLFGQAAGIWQFVGEQAAQSDFSDSGLATVGNYIATDPMGAVMGAGEGILAGLPGILGAVL